jgi:hypothetical protein
VHRCDWHMWQPEGWEFCWRCEELTKIENKKKYENKFRDNSLQRVGGNQEFGSVSTGTQESSGRDSSSL